MRKQDGAKGEAGLEQPTPTSKGASAADRGPAELSEGARMTKPLPHQPLWSVTGCGPSWEGCVL